MQEVFPCQICNIMFWTLLLQNTSCGCFRRTDCKRNMKFPLSIQGIIQEFNLGVGSRVNITLWCELCSRGVDGGGDVRPPCKPPSPLFCYISLLDYMKHLICWQLILIFLYLTSAWMFFFFLLHALFPTI